MADSIAIWISKNNQETKSVTVTTPTINDEEEIATEEIATEETETNKVDDPSPHVELHFNYWSISEDGFTKKSCLYGMKAKGERRRGLLRFSFLLLYRVGVVWSYFTRLANKFFGENTISFLDVGVKYQYLDGDICLYLPFRLMEDEYDGDLCLRMSKERELLSTLFNNSVKIDESLTSQELISKISFFKEDKDEEVYLIKNLSINKDNEIGTGVTLNLVQDGGCCLTFPQKILNLPNESNYGYFRFRIMLSKYNKEKISTYYKAKDRFFSAKDEMIELIDFRINEIRNIPPQFKEELVKRDIISSVHFFAIREVNTEFLMSDDKYSRCRLLEGPLWKSYLESNQFLKINNIPLSLIYHWKKKGKINVNMRENLDKYTAFAKFSYSRFSISAILRNIIVIILLAISANSIYFVLYERWFKDILSTLIS